MPDSEFDTPDSILVVEWVEFPGQGLAKAVRVLAGPVEAKPSRGFSPTPPLPTRSTLRSRLARDDAIFPEEAEAIAADMLEHLRRGGSICLPRRKEDDNTGTSIAAAGRAIIGSLTGMIGSGVRGIW